VLVVSGGISMGNYQAGQLWVLMEYLQRCNLAGQLRDGAGWVPYDLVVVGTSAGAVNTTLIAAELLTRPTAAPDARERPEASVLYQSWASVGFGPDADALDHRAPGRPAQALFSREGSDRALSAMLDLPLADGAWPGALRLAVTTSLVAPITDDPLKPHTDAQFAIEVAPAAAAPRAPGPLRGLGVTWRHAAGPGATGTFGPTPRDPTAELAPGATVCAAQDADPMRWLVLDADGLRGWTSPARAKPELWFPCLYRASSAIPIAFEAETYTWSAFAAREYQRCPEGVEGWAGARCAPESPARGRAEQLGGPRDTFVGRRTAAPLISLVDGGVLDNNPRWLATALVPPGGPPAQRWNVHTYDHAEWPLHTGHPGLDMRAFFGTLVPAARGKDLVERGAAAGGAGPGGGWVTLAPSPDHPAVSSHLSSFMGFVDRSFRLWDFQQGARAAAAALRAQAAAGGPTIPGPEAWVDPRSPISLAPPTTSAPPAGGAAPGSAAEAAEAAEAAAARRRPQLTEADCLPAEPPADGVDWLPAVATLRSGDRPTDLGSRCAAARLQRNFEALTAVEGAGAVHPAAGCGQTVAAAQAADGAVQAPRGVVRTLAAGGVPSTEALAQMEDDPGFLFWKAVGAPSCARGTDALLTALDAAGFRLHDIRPLPRPTDRAAFDRRGLPTDDPPGSAEQLRARLSWALSGLETVKGRPEPTDGDLPAWTPARRRGVLDTLGDLPLERDPDSGDAPRRDRRLIEEAAGVQALSAAGRAWAPLQASTLSSGRRVGILIGVPSGEWGAFLDPATTPALSSTEGSWDTLTRGLRTEVESPMLVGLRITRHDRSRLALQDGWYSSFGVSAGDYLLPKPGWGLSLLGDLRFGYDFARGAAERRVVGAEAGPLTPFGWRYWQVGLFGQPGRIWGADVEPALCPAGLACATLRSLNGWGMKAGVEVNFLPIARAAGLSLRWSLTPHAFSEWGRSFDRDLHGGGFPGTLSLAVVGELNRDRVPISGRPPGVPRPPPRPPTP
jgi:hypothetical protein